MYLTRKVGERGQVVIPEEIREEAGVAPGAKVRFDYKDGIITIQKEKSDRELFKEFCKGLPDEKRGRFDIDKILDEAYEERLRKKLK